MTEGVPRGHLGPSEKSKKVEEAGKRALQEAEERHNSYEERIPADDMDTTWPAPGSEF